MIKVADVANQVDPMNRDDVLDLLRIHKPTLEQRFGVTKLALYGSFARDQAGASSDVDVLVEFKTPPGWRQYFGAQFYLEDLLGRKVDLATGEEIRIEIRPYVERDTINV